MVMRNQHTIIVMLLGSLLACVLACPLEAQGDLAAEAFVAKQVATRTLSADLKQTFHWTMPPRHVESSGRFFYQAPGSLCIKLTNAAPEIIVVRGSDLYIKRGSQPLTHAVLANRNGKPTQNVQFLLSFFQNGCTNYAGLFNLRTSVSTNIMTVTMTPRDTLKLFPLRRVTNLLDWPSMEIHSMRIGLIFSNYIAYDFCNVVRNQTLDAAVFDIPPR